MTGTSIQNRNGGGLALLAELETAGALTPTSLSLPATTTFEQWEATGRLLALMTSVTPWLIGDHYVFGEAAFGTRAEGAEVYGVNADTVSTYAWVCRNIEAAERRPELKLSHHRLVVKNPNGGTMSKTERRKWLARAVKEGWGTREMRAALLAAKAIEEHSTENGATPEPELEISPREALTTIRQDDTWKAVATAALKSLDDEHVCPACGNVFRDEEP